MRQVESRIYVLYSFFCLYIPVLLLSICLQLPPVAEKEHGVVGSLSSLVTRAPSSSCCQLHALPSHPLFLCCRTIILIISQLTVAFKTYIFFPNLYSVMISLLFHLES